MQSNYKNFEDLPLTLSVKDVSNVLGLSISKVYQLMSTDEFPRLALGRRVIVPKDSFVEWMQANTQ